ncbi:MAG: tRNA(Ile)(2)-agmatinylcytidine synthase [Nitrososphaerales archaeon]
MLVHIGIDDTDSKMGGCTTYTATEAVRQLLISKLAIFKDYPKIIRLNPNIPWKTRGNAAVALTLETDEPKAVFETVCRAVEENLTAHLDSAATLILDHNLEQLRDYAQRALYTVVKMSEARALCKKLCTYTKLWGRGSGLKGALAAIGNDLSRGDYTYELLAYRRREYWGKPRLIDPQSVYDLDKHLNGLLFNNYDPETRRILITPHGPDPVYFGIRGESTEALLKALSILKPQQPVDRWMIFRTNQGTAQHLQTKLNPNALKAYESGYIQGVVASRAVIGKGGHLYIHISTNSTKIKCAVYEPTGPFRKLFQQLVEGDFVEVAGGVRRATAKHPKVLNVEYLKIIKLKKILQPVKPLCGSCGIRMKSKGREGYFKCRRCGSKKKATEFAEATRNLKEGVYIPPPRAHRHLTKPITRWGLEKTKWDGKISSRWYWFSDLRDL